MVRVGVRELRRQIGFYLKKVQEGEPVLITRRDKPIASLTPVERNKEKIIGLVREGLAQWNYGKPQGGGARVAVSGKPVSQIVLKERR